MAALRELARQAVEEAPNETIDAINQRLARRVEQYNLAPQPELGGLSPAAMAKLLYGDWSGSGGLRLNANLVPHELTESDMLHSARAVLRQLAKGPMKQTQAGNLSRLEVLRLLPSLRVRFDAERFLAVSKVINEYDVAWLHLLRHTLMTAGLVLRRKGFRITRLGRSFLPDAQMGSLFALLFETVFRRINLAVLDLTDRHLGLQSTVAYSFYRLRSVTEWTSDDELADLAWLESAKDPMTPSESEFGDHRSATFRRRVLEPLAMFGLVEQRDLPGEAEWPRRFEYRKAPLFDRFLRFA